MLFFDEQLVLKKKKMVCLIILLYYVFFSIRNVHWLDDIIFTQIYVEKASNVIYEKKDKIMQGQNALR